MLKIVDDLSRREWLRIGGLGLGALSLEQLLAARAAAAPGRTGKAKSVIVLCLIGGVSQYESWDPKPLAPAEIRGPFENIATRTPGLHINELLPKMAQYTDRLAILRGMVTNDNAHSSSGYQMFTGMPHVPMNLENATPKAPNNWPNFGAVVRALRSDAGRLPSAITLPADIRNVGNAVWPGQDAGFLGARYHPWVIDCDPSAREFRPPDLTLANDTSTLRFDGRRSLLHNVDDHLDTLLRSQAPERYTSHAQRAFDLLASGSARKAFDLGQEPSHRRERYGMTRFGQSVLLARRLVEAGVSLVQINWRQIDGYPNYGSWDTHEKHNYSVKALLNPMMDQFSSALLEDLEARGLLDETLVVWWTEFGRTPRYNSNGGRDHWGQVFSIALAGGGVRGGVVYGASDRNGAYPADGRVEARDLLATVFHCLGYDSHTEVHDVQNRPIPISRGNVLQSIL